MGKLRFLVSLITNLNDYQLEQAKDAEETARKLGIEVQVFFAESDPVLQSQQLLEVIQRKSSRPDGIVVQPAGTPLATVAKAAAGAGIGWCILNRSAVYLPELRKSTRSPMFSVSSDHLEVGRIQGLQLAALLPKGGNVLFIQGPGSNTSAQQRTEGILCTKPASVNFRTVKGQWTEKSGYDAVASWLRLSTSRDAEILGVVAQNDDMAIGARRAFQELTSGEERDHWMNIPFLGCDGLPKTGRAYVDRGILRATVHIPSHAGRAVEMLSQAITSGTNPPEHTIVPPESYPPVEKLSAKKAAVTI